MISARGQVIQRPCRKKTKWNMKERGWMNEKVGGKQNENRKINFKSAVAASFFFFVGSRLLSNKWVGRVICDVLQWYFNMGAHECTNRQTDTHTHTHMCVHIYIYICILIGNNDWYKYMPKHAHRHTGTHLNTQIQIMHIALWKCYLFMLNYLH